MSRLILYIAVILMMSSCFNNDPDLTENNPRIKKELDERRYAYQKRKLNECKKDIFNKATIYVDSVISARISYQLSDSIFFPPKPDKPTSGNPVIIEDTIRAKPLKR